MIRLATVGTSRICESFIEAAFLTGEYELSAVYSRKRETGESFAEKFGCARVFTDLSDMANDSETDAVYIASPNVFHAEMSRLFLENGKHVICEKPIVTSLHDYVENKAVADRNGLIYMEAMIPIHNSEYESIKNAVKMLGKIKGARLDYSQRSSRLDRFLCGEKVNIFDMSLHAGAFMDLGVYVVHGAVDLLGVPNEVVSSNSQLLYNGADGAGEVTLRYNGFDAVLSYSKLEDSSVGSCIYGEMGYLKMDMISQYSGAVLVIGENETVLTGHLPKKEQMRGEAQSFAEYIVHYEENRTKYEKFSGLCFDVCECMEKIKFRLGLKYN